MRTHAKRLFYSLVIAGFSITSMAGFCGNPWESSEGFLRGADRTPRWTADGRTLIVNISRNIQAIGVDRAVVSTVTPFSDEGNPYSPSALAPTVRFDGSVAYRRNWLREWPIGGHSQNSAIYRTDLHGTRHEELSDVGYLVDRPVWSPDGSRIAFTTWFEEFEGKVNVSVLGSMAADGSDVRLYGTAGNAGPPVWSPDGSRIAASDGEKMFVAQDRITIVDWRSGITRKTIQVDRTDGAIIMNAIDWSASDGTIYFIIAKENGSDSTGRLFAVEPDGTSLRSVFKSDDGWVPNKVAASPDGEQILLRVVRQNLVDLTWGNNDMPSGHVYLIDRDGENPKRLEKLVRDGDGEILYDSPHRFALWAAGASWSPDGSRIAVIFADDSEWPFFDGLVVMDLEGSYSRTLIHRSKDTSGLLEAIDIRDERRYKQRFGFREWSPGDW